MPGASRSGRRRRAAHRPEPGELRRWRLPIPPWRRPVRAGIVGAVEDAEANVGMNGKAGSAERAAGDGRGRRDRSPGRRPYTFLLDGKLVERARREVGEQDVVRSIEAALVAALDYQLWVREVSAGERGLLS